MDIYFAGPLFSQAERGFNLQLTDKLEASGFSVFLPQRDGIEIVKPPYDQMTHSELTRTIFTTDRDKILEADIFLFILDGRVPDDGACVELGIAYAQKQLLQRDKLLVGLHTDFRDTSERINFMILGALDTIVHNEDSLISVLEEYRDSKGLTMRDEDESQ
jgi:nucleoside 2-deoxyribosyltransferase